MNVLLVGAPPRRFETLAAGLREGGLMAESAPDAQAALWKVASGDFRVVVVELADEVPWDLIEAALWTRPPARVIALAAPPVEASLRRKAYSAGVWELIEIPGGSAGLSAPGLAAAVRRALGRAGVPAVLFVDPCAEITEGIGALIADEGYRVEAAGSGAEALRLMASREYALVITETRRIGHDGFQVLREAARRQPGVPVLVLTTTMDDTTFMRAIELGAAGCLWKLAEPEEIMSEIRVAMRIRQERGTTRIGEES